MCLCLITRTSMAGTGKLTFQRARIEPVLGMGNQTMTVSRLQEISSHVFVCQQLKIPLISLYFSLVSFRFVSFQSQAGRPPWNIFLILPMATAYVNPQQGLGEKAGTSRCPNACVCHLQADRGKPYRRELTQSVDS